jgi:uncharacterized protein with HEPN domain
MRDSKTRLQDILDAIDAIGKYSNKGKDAFLNDELIQNWFVRHLQIIGEAAYAISDEVKAKPKVIPWDKIVGMRHILVHDYFAIDTDIVWDVVEKDLPSLKVEVQKLINSL